MERKSRLECDESASYVAPNDATTDILSFRYVLDWFRSVGHAQCF
jgi:hypothetical protein